MKARANYLLAIGIDDTSAAWPKLANAVSDTKALVDVLTTRYSFELVQAPLYNAAATRENIITAFSSALQTLGDDDNLIIYFAGHGFMHPLSQKGYWVPHGARQNIVDFISNADIKDFIEKIPSMHIFLIADACFSGTFLTRTRGGRCVQSYQSLNEKVSRWMLASGGEETVSDGPAGKSSPFAKYLLKFLHENVNKYASAVEVIRYVSVLTTYHSGQRSQGAYIGNIGHDGGEMVLILGDPWTKTKIETTDGTPATKELAREMRAVYRKRSTLSGGKEVLFVDSLLGHAGLFVLENFRFDDNGEKKLKFENDKVKMPAKDSPDELIPLIQRFATMEGLNRYLDKHQNLYKERKIHVLPVSPEIENVEETEAAIRQQEIIQDLYDSNQTPMQCLHCGEMISTNDSYFVEIDEIGLKENVGNVHAECLRPADRVIGLTTYPNLGESKLVNFDYEKWLVLRKRGQAFLSNAQKTAEGKDTFIMVWNREHSQNSGNYCINMILADGTSRYLRLGKGIHRFSEMEIDKEVETFNLSFKEAREENDPEGITSESKISGRFSRLEKVKLASEQIIEIVRVEKARYSQQLEAISNDIDNDYAPLGLLLDRQSNIVNFGNCIPLISDPTKIEALYENWQKAGYPIGDYIFKIIEDDKELDAYLIGFFAEKMQPIIDPMFDEDMELQLGIYLVDIEDIKNEEHVSSVVLNPDDAVLKAGDRVKVVFSSVETDKHAQGILLTDEFIDEQGEPSVIFRPIEDGIVRDDMQFKMPANLIVKL